MKKIKVLVVDHSAVMRKFLSDVISSAGDIEVVATALDFKIASNKVRMFPPDVITLDINIPGDDLETFLSEVKSEYTVPIVVISDSSAKASKKAVSFLGAGAVDFLLKPSFRDIGTRDALVGFSEELHERIRAAARSRKMLKLSSPLPKMVPGVVAGEKHSKAVIAMGASTGGVEALFSIITRLPETLPGILVVQHMPVEFTGPFAERVNKFSRLRVAEAQHGDRVIDGTALIAPGNKHLQLRRDAKGFYAALDDGAPVGVGRFKPAVDVLFNSVADIAGNNALGILLTGMGADGARGLLGMKEAGALTIAQDQRSSVVFGMPMKAIEMGAATMIKSLEEIVQHLQNFDSMKNLNKMQN